MANGLPKPTTPLEGVTVVGVLIMQRVRIAAHVAHAHTIIKRFQDCDWMLTAKTDSFVGGVVNLTFERHHPDSDVRPIAEEVAELIK